MHKFGGPAAEMIANDSMNSFMGILENIDALS